MNPESYTKLSGFIFITHVRSVHGMRKYAHFGRAGEGRKNARF